jgi:hypothetical protein
MNQGKKGASLASKEKVDLSALISRKSLCAAFAGRLGKLSQHRISAAGAALLVLETMIPATAFAAEDSVTATGRVQLAIEALAPAAGLAVRDIKNTQAPSKNRPAGLDFRRGKKLFLGCQKQSSFRHDRNQIERHFGLYQVDHNDGTL